MRLTVKNILKLTNIKKILAFIILIITVISGFFLDVAPIHVPNGINLIYHFAGFFFVTFIITYNFLNFFNRKYLNQWLIVAIVFGSLIAAFAEKLQYYTPSRDCNPVHWLANVSGIATATAIIFFVNQILINKDNL